MFSQIRQNAWKFLTTAVVLVFALNPEMIPFALFVDAVGIEVLLLLLELQLLTMFVWPLYARITGGMRLVHRMLVTVGSPATLMQLLVIIAFVMQTLPVLPGSTLNSRLSSSPVAACLYGA